MFSGATQERVAPVRLLSDGIDATRLELQTLITQARVLWNDKKFNDVRALEPQIQELLIRLAKMLEPDILIDAPLEISE